MGRHLDNGGFNLMSGEKEDDLIKDSQPEPFGFGVGT